MSRSFPINPIPGGDGTLDEYYFIREGDKVILGMEYRSESGAWHFYEQDYSFGVVWDPSIGMPTRIRYNDPRFQATLAQKWAESGFQLVLEYSLRNGQGFNWVRAEHAVFNASQCYYREPLPKVKTREDLDSEAFEEIHHQEGVDLSKRGYFMEGVKYARLAYGLLYVDGDRVRLTEAIHVRNAITMQPDHEFPAGHPADVVDASGGREISILLKIDDGPLNVITRVNVKQVEPA